MNMDFDVHVHEALERLSVDFLFSREMFGRREVLMPVVFTVKTFGPDDLAQVSGPTLTLSRQTTQAIFQRLWNIGYRPSSGSSGVAEVDALKSHIKFAEHVALSFLPKEVKR